MKEAGSIYRSTPSLNHVSQLSNGPGPALLPLSLCVSFIHALIHLLTHNTNVCPAPLSVKRRGQEVAAPTLKISAPGRRGHGAQGCTRVAGTGSGGARGQALMKLGAWIPALGLGSSVALGRPPRRKLVPATLLPPAFPTHLPALHAKYRLRQLQSQFLQLQNAEKMPKSDLWKVGLSTHRSQQRMNTRWTPHC